MSRYHFVGRTRDSMGNIVPDIDIYVYLSGTTSAATVYTHPTTGSGSTSAPQIVSDDAGGFSFYLDEADYPLYQLFDIVANDITYANIDIIRRGQSGYSGYSGFGSSGISGVSGWSGYSGIGFSGYSGESGSSGISGYSGWSGVSGFGESGYSGWSGTSGYSGFGESGYSGWSGTSGYSGWSGVSGLNGAAGESVSGYSGWSGVSGFGESGISGYSGWSGVSGFSGAAGESVVFDSTPDTNQTVNGLLTDYIVGEELSFGDLCYLNADGKMYKSDASDSTMMPAMFFATETISADLSGGLLSWGFARDDSWSWTTGQVLYASTITGEMTQIAPSADSEQLQITGLAIASNIILFCPSPVVIEIGLDIQSKDTGYTITWSELTAQPKVFTCESSSDQTFTFSAPETSDIGKQFWIVKTGTGAGSIIIDAPATVAIDSGTTGGTVTCDDSNRASILMMVVSTTQIQTLTATGNWTWS